MCAGEKCHVDEGCDRWATRQSCGHIACDYHTDESGMCMICVDLGSPADEVDDDDSPWGAALDDEYPPHRGYYGELKEMFD